MTKPVRLDVRTHKDVTTALRETLKVYTKALKKFSRCGISLEAEEKFAGQDKVCRAALQTITLLLKLKLMIQYEDEGGEKRDPALEAAYEAASQQLAELGEQFDD